MHVVDSYVEIEARRPPMHQNVLANVDWDFGIVHELRRKFLSNGVTRASKIRDEDFRRGRGMRRYSCKRPLGSMCRDMK